MGPVNTNNEKFLLNFLKVVPDIMAAVNQDGYLVFVNEAMLNILGYSEDELKSKPLSEFIHPDDREKTTNEIQELFTGKTTFSFENRYLTKTGQAVWFHWSANLGEDGLVYGLAKEISRYKEIEEWLQVNKKQLESTNQELNEFAYIVSHDLKAPLRGISSLAQWMLEDHGEKLEESCRDDLELIKDRANHADSLIDSLLQYSRAANKTDKMDLINSRELVEEILTTLDYSDSINIIIGEGLPSIKYPRTQFYQVMQNLISNSIKYIDDKKEKSFIEVNCKDENEFFMFYVKDNGLGIDKKHHERVFKIFQTVGVESKESTGVGLSIVKKIVERFSGRIELESELDEGTTMKVFIPKKLGEEQ